MVEYIALAVPTILVLAGLIVIIRALFPGCKHEWIVNDRGDLTRYGRKIGRYVIKECSVCHKLKTEESA